MDPDPAIYWPWKLDRMTIFQISFLLNQLLVSTEPKQINKTFSEFYAILYQSERQLNKTECENYLKQLDLPCLSVEDSLNLDNPLTLEELEKAALSMQSNKSSGLDGIPPEF